MVQRCTDKKCKGFGKPLVDRGYGYPVCPTVFPLNISDDGFHPFMAIIFSKSKCEEFINKGIK